MLLPLPPEQSSSTCGDVFYLVQNIQSDRVEEILHNDPQDRALASDCHACIDGRSRGGQRHSPGLHLGHGLQSCLGTLQEQKKLLEPHFCFQKTTQAALLELPSLQTACWIQQWAELRCFEGWGIVETESIKTTPTSKGKAKMPTKSTMQYLCYGKTLLCISWCSNITQFFRKRENQGFSESISRILDKVMRLKDWCTFATEIQKWEVPGVLQSPLTHNTCAPAVRGTQEQHFICTALGALILIGISSKRESKQRGCTGKEPQHLNFCPKKLPKGAELKLGTFFPLQSGWCRDPWGLRDLLGSGAATLKLHPPAPGCAVPQLSSVPPWLHLIETF